MTYLSNWPRWLLLACLVISLPSMAAEMDGLIAGNWVEVRGGLDEQGVFVAQRVELFEPQQEEVLISTVTDSPGPDKFILLGQPVQISPKTKFSKLDASELLNQRVKVEGHYRGPKRMSARKISARGAGRDRISGLITDLRRNANGYVLRIMNLQIAVASDIELRHDKAVKDYAVASLNVALPEDKQLSEDDQFGEGVRITDRIRFTTLIEARYKGEDNYDLDDRREQDRQATAGSIRGRFLLAPSGHGISGQLEIRYTRLHINDDLLGTFNINDTRLGESFIYLDDPFDFDLDFQVGRMDFDDRREWLYDQNLDGLRVYWGFSGWLAELSATTTLSAGKLRDENTNNYMAYFSDTGRRLAAYVIYRDTDLPGLQEKVTHLGLRAFGNWPPEHESWLEISNMQGSRNDIDLRGWGFDIGTTRAVGKRWFLTAGWAFGQGDDQYKSGTDGNFRQTRLQDNNGKFGGVTSFRYYGELLDPELSNMHIGTLGVGYQFVPKGSIDLVGHYYRQDKATRKIFDSDIDQRPNGIERELGWEIDVIVGWRPVRSWDFEVVLGRFTPGKAFQRRDNAWVGKLQARFRY